MALARVNDNFAALTQPLQYKALVSFRFRDADGRDRRFIGHEAALFFREPRWLRFDIRSLTGTVAGFGANDERYWLWIDPEVNKLWWGSWAVRDAGVRSGLVIDPADLLDALMLRPLPEALAGGLNMMLRVEGGDYRLMYNRLGPDGRLHGWREIRLDPYEPYLPLEIVDRLPDGRVQMRAELKNYRRIGADGPYTARNYVVVWPVDHAELRMDVTRAVLRPDLPLDAFAFPDAWEGDVECLDTPTEDWSVPGTLEDEP
ncbi:MAG: hypothetical protein PVJ57_10440 [Phycisphaerae bacterium]